MSQHRIAVIVGSHRHDSFNNWMASTLAKIAPPDFLFVQTKIGDLPLYDQDDDAHHSAPVKRLKADIASARGLLFVTPEYNRSMPGVLRNALEHASRPFGESAWKGKPAGIIGVLAGAMGTAVAQQYLRNILAYLDAPALGQPEAFIHAREDLFDPDGSIGQGSKAFLQDWMQHYLAWVTQHTGR